MRRAATCGVLLVIKQSLITSARYIADAEDAVFLASPLRHGTTGKSLLAVYDACPMDPQLLMVARIHPTSRSCVFFGRC